MPQAETKPTHWHHYVSYFFGGSFFSNGVPHVIMGITGHSFQSPIASMTGQQVSSPIVNVLWGGFNLTLGYLLVCRVGSFELRRTSHVLIAGVGFLIMSLFSAYAFGRLHAQVGILPK